MAVAAGLSMTSHTVSLQSIATPKRRGKLSTVLKGLPSMFLTANPLSLR